MPGQTIAIMASGGTRRVKATVPAGLKPGDTFLVRLATPINPEPAAAVAATSSTGPYHGVRQATMTTTSPHFGPALDEWLAPPQENKNPDWSNPSKSSAEKQPEEAHDHHQYRDPPSYAARGFVSGREAPAAHDYYHQVAPDYSVPQPKEMEAREQLQTIKYEPEPPLQKFLLVRVPPGMPPGTILQVEIPGEGRTVAAQVPPNAGAFHVVYTPQPQPPSPPAQQQHPPTIVHTLPQPTTTNQQPTSKPQEHSKPQEYSDSQRHSQPQENNGQLPKDVQPTQSNKPRRKLLLVRVPPDTPQGTTLHVSIPNEPGRILAAVVPPGNVTEFHVSYEPRAPRKDSSGGHQEIPKVQYYGEKAVEGAAVGENAHERYNNTL